MFCHITSHHRTSGNTIQMCRCPICQNHPKSTSLSEYKIIFTFFFFKFHRISCFPHDHCFCRLEVHGHWQHVMPRASFRKTLGCRIYRTKERVAANTHLGSLFRQCKMDCFSFFECLQLCFYFLMCNFRFKRNGLVLDQPQPGFGIQTIGGLPASRWNGKNMFFFSFLSDPCFGNSLPFRKAMCFASNFSCHGGLDPRVAQLRYEFMEASATNFYPDPTSLPLGAWWRGATKKFDQLTRLSI